MDREDRYSMKNNYCFFYLNSYKFKCNATLGIFWGGGGELLLSFSFERCGNLP